MKLTIQYCVNHKNPRSEFFATAIYDFLIFKTWFKMYGITDGSFPLQLDSPGIAKVL